MVSSWCTASIFRIPTSLSLPPDNLRPVLKDTDSGTQGNYRQLQDALRAAGAIRNLFLTDQKMEAGKGYNIRLRGSLDIESLPTPGRLPAYVSSAWDMKSEWYAWPLVR